MRCSRVRPRRAIGLARCDLPQSRALQPCSDVIILVSLTPQVKSICGAFERTIHAFLNVIEISKNPIFGYDYRVRSHSLTHLRWSTDKNKIAQIFANYFHLASCIFFFFLLFLSSLQFPTNTHLLALVFYEYLQNKTLFAGVIWKMRISVD